jgi:hypothetical protein
MHAAAAQRNYNYLTNVIFAVKHVDEYGIVPGSVNKKTLEMMLGPIVVRLIMTRTDRRVTVRLFVLYFGSVRLTTKWKALWILMRKRYQFRKRNERLQRIGLQVNMSHTLQL